MSDTPKTVAESAYCKLLAMPVPKTPLDFRRAIVMAVLIGRQIEADPQPSQRPKQVQTPE